MPFQLYSTKALTVKVIDTRYKCRKKSDLR